MKLCFVLLWQSFSKHFSRTNGLTKRWCVIDLMNLSGESWALGLRHNNRTGQDYIRGHWRSFCRANEMKPGSSYRFKLVRNGTRPLLRLCSEVIPEGNRSRANGKDNVSEKYSRAAGSASTKQNKFLTVTFKHYMIQSGHLVSFQHLRFRVNLIMHFLVILHECFETYAASSEIICEGERDQGGRRDNSSGQKWSKVAILCSFCQTTRRVLHGTWLEKVL